jgi:hypothetical protein
VVADDMLLRVVVFSHYGQLLHVKAAAVEFLHGLLGPLVTTINRNHRIIFGHA